MLFFDIETDGLLDTVTRIHSLVIKDSTSGEIHSLFGESIQRGITLLHQSTDKLCGHNILGFDIPCIEKLYGISFPRSRIVDTLVIARLKYPEVKTFDAISKRLGRPIPIGKAYGTHSLEAWGYRLGVLKGTFGKTTDWKEWTKDMQLYCEQDVAVTEALFRFLNPMELSSQALRLEHLFADYISWQEYCGCPFDITKANKLLSKVLIDYDKAYLETCSKIPPFIDKEVFVPRVNNKTRGYVKGVPITKTTETKFNPNSRSHIIRLFKEKYNWVPTEFTEKGNPEVSGEILSELPYPEAKTLAHMFDVSKLRGQLSTGDNSWLGYVKNGKIHGRVNPNGTITGRCAHFAPNLGQVPASHAYMGLECRELFHSGSEDLWMVGCDAKALELRVMAHYLYPYDKGAFAHTVINGDVHTENQTMAGLPTRDAAKTFIYAFLYGAGDLKLGLQVKPDASEEEARYLGKELRRRFLKNFPALNQLILDVKTRFKKRQYLTGLDGRKLIPRGDHSALNTLFQSAGAIIMKQAVVNFHDYIRNDKGIWPALQIHDEIDVICTDAMLEKVRQSLPLSITKAGEILKVNCLMEGNVKVGKNWREVH